MTIRHAAFMLMESSWLLGLLILFDAALPHAGPPLYPALLLYPLGYLMARAVPIRDERRWVEIAISAGLLLATIALGAAFLLSWPLLQGETPDLRALQRFAGAAAICAIGWIRGWLLAGRQVELKGVVGSFQVGLAIILVILLSASDLGVAVSTQIALALLYVASGLFGLWHARSGAGSATPDGNAPRRNPGTAFLGFVAVLAVGLLLWSALDRTALEAGLTALAWLGARLRGLLEALASYFPDASSEPASGPAYEPLPQLPVPQPQPLPETPPLLRRIGLVMFVAPLIILAGVVLFNLVSDITRWLGGRRRTRGIHYGASSTGALEQLRTLMRRLLAWLGGRLPYLRSRIESWRRSRRTEGSVRGRYRQLLRRLGGRGWRRNPGETPDEYRRRLVPEWPDSSPYLARLTEAFVADRYGGRSFEPAMAEDLWQRLRKALWKLRRRNG